MLTMRDKLIHAAIEKFGQRGFDAVGTREIAAAVGTPMSSITYHFGSKEGLYIAAAEYIFGRLQQMVQPSPAEMPLANASREERISALCNTLRRVGEFTLRDESAPFALFIGREQQAPTPRVLELMKVSMRPVMEMFVEQIQILRPDIGERQARATTLFLLGMTISLRHSRASLLLLLDVEKIDSDTAEMLLGQLDQTARLILSGGAP